MVHRHPAVYWAAVLFPQRYAPVTRTQHTHRLSAIERGGDLLMHAGIPEGVASNHAYPWHAASRGSPRAFLSREQTL